MYDRLNVDPEELRGVGIQLSKLEKIGKPNKALANFLYQGKKLAEIVTEDNNGNIPSDTFKNPNVINTKNDGYKEITNKNTNINSQVVETVPIVVKSVPDKTATISKRGRSGKKVNNTTNKACTNLTNYFKNTKSDVATVKEVMYKYILFELTECKVNMGCNYY